MEHGAKAAKAFASLIKQTAPKDNKPGKNRSLVIGKVGLKPVMLVSPKKPTNALTELNTMSAKLGKVTPLVLGQVVFEDNVVHLKALKNANEQAVKKAFLDYYAAYKIRPPSLRVKLWQPQDWEAAEFEEDKNDTGAVDEDEDEGESESRAVDEEPDESGSGDEDADESGEAETAEGARARMTEAAERFKKFQAIVGTTPQAQPFIKNAQGKLQEAYAKFKAADYPGMGAALESSRQLLLAAGKAHQGQQARPQSSTEWQSAPTANVKPQAQVGDAANRAAGSLGAARARETAAARQQKLTDQQKAQYDEMAPVLADVARTYFTPNAAAGSGRLKKESLNAGTHFKTYLGALEGLETLKAQAGANPSAQQLTALKTAADRVAQAAQAHLDHFDRDLKDSEKSDKIALRKKQICGEGLKAARHYAIATELQGIGAPTTAQPWSQEQQVRVNGLRAQFAFETGYKKAARLGGGGQSESYWVESVPPGSKDKDATKNFIFKPAAGEKSALSDPKGAGAVKESLASAKAKLFEQQTGIDLGVPETSVTTIGSYAIASADGGNEPKIGSIQQFAKSDGELPEQGPGILDRIHPEECQRMALNDIMALNVDRHVGNFMVQNGAGPNGSPKLVPIDHGCTLPTLADFKHTAVEFGGIAGNYSKNILLHMPGAHEKFSQDMQDRIALIEPDKIAAGTKDHLAALDRVNPGLDATAKVPQESIDLSTRVMKFLKRAAPTLSPAEIQIAIAQNKDIFANPNQDIEQVADQIIQDAAPKGPGYAEYFGLSGDQRKKIVKRLMENKWVKYAGEADEFIMKDPVTALKLYKGNVAKGPADAATAARGVNMQTALTSSAQDMLKDAANMLPSADPTAVAALTQRHQQLAAMAPTDERQAKSLEDQAKTLCRDVRNSCLSVLEKEGTKLYKDNIDRYLEGDSKRKAFSDLYTTGLLRAVSAQPDIKDARRFIGYMQEEIGQLPPTQRPASGTSRTSESAFETARTSGSA